MSNICIRCNKEFNGRWPKEKICKGCSRRGAKRGKENAQYKNGAYTYETIRNDIRQARKFCENCEKDLREATHYFWVIHHKDHDHFNNDDRNLELLCKRCHQIEHKCWLAFSKGATTISKESTAK